MGKRDSNDNAKVQAVADALELADSKDKIAEIAKAVMACNPHQFTAFVLPELGNRLPVGLADYIDANYEVKDKSSQAVQFKGRGKSREVKTLLIVEQLRAAEAMPKTEATAPAITPEIQAVLDDRGMSYEEFLTAAATAYANRFAVKGGKAEAKVKTTLTEQVPLIIAAAKQHNETEPDHRISITGAVVAAITGLRANDVNKHIGSIAGADIAAFNEHWQVNQYSNRGKDVPALLGALMAD